MKIPHKLFKLLTLILLWATGFMTTSVKAVGIVGYSIEGGTAGIMYPADLAGAPGVRTNNWNNITSYFSATLADGVTTFANDSSGNPVNGMTVVFNQGNGGDFTWVGGATTNDVTLYNGVGDSSGGLGWLYITNIPYATYDVYFYVRSGDDNSGRVGYFTNLDTGEQRWIKDTTSISTPANTGSGYVEALYTNVPTTVSVIPGGNYVHFINETNPNLHLNFAAYTGTGISGANTGVPRLKLVGFQIVEIPTINATNISLSPASIPYLHAYNSSPFQVSVNAQFNDGTSGNITSSPKIVYTSSNTNIFTVTATGQIYPKTNGTANLIVYYPNVYATNAVTNIGPTALSISLDKKNLLVGNGVADMTQAHLLATYIDATNVDATSFNPVSFSSSPSGVVGVNNNGVVTAMAAGTFSLSGTYDGLNVTSNNIGNVSAFTPPGAVPAISVRVADATHQMTFHDLSGAPGARVGYWNNLVTYTGNVTNQIATPIDYHGNPVPNAVVQLIPGTPNAAAVYTLGTLTANESLMFGVVLDVGMNNGTSYNSQIVVSNVPYASYDAYFYFDNDTGATDRPGRVTIDGVTQYRINSASYPAQPDNNGNGYVQAVQPATITTSISSVPFGNFIKFSGVTDAVLNVSWGAVGQDVFSDANVITRLRLTGFQLVKSLINLPCTNIYLQSAVPNLLPGNPAPVSVNPQGDFTDGTKGGSLAGLPGLAFASSNTNIFNVDTNGVITAGLTNGSAMLTMTYQTNIFTTTVTALAPIAVSVSASPDTFYFNGVNGAGTGQANVTATFAGYGSVKINSYNGVSFLNLSPSVISVSGTGAITPVATTADATADLGASYLGISYTNLGAVSVRSISDPISLTNATNLKHRYSFRDATGSTTVKDSAGGANGTVIAPLSGGAPIVLDGEQAQFPANSDYSIAPYIKLPAGLISARGDVTIDMWVTVNVNATWERFFDIGSSSKGNDAHNSGSGITSLFCTPFPGDSGFPRFTLQDSAGVSEVLGTSAMPLGTEQHLTLVYAYNQGITKMYVNGVLANSATPLSGATLQTLNDQNVWLGASLWNDPPFVGSIDELRIYEGGFSDANAAASDSAGPNLGQPASVTRTNVTAVVNGSNLTLSWPANHQGFSLQVQTNGLNGGLGTNWVTVPGSSAGTSVNVTINPTNPAVFYRLFYQP